MALDFKNLHFNAYTLLVLILAALGSVGYGYNVGSIALALGVPSFISYMDLATRSDAEELIGAMIGTFFAAGIFGTLANSYIADRWGRRRALMVAATGIIVNAALQAGSVNPVMFTIFRTIDGFFSFAILTAVPLYLSELVPAAVRGALVDLNGVALAFGYTCVGWVSYGLFHYNSPSNWRIAQALGAVFPLIVLCSLPFLPESPRWLAAQGRSDEAYAVLARMHTDKSGPRHDFAKIEHFQIMKQCELDKTLDSSWRAVFTKRSNIKRALCAFHIGVLFQFSGILVVANYSAAIYTGLGYDAEQSTLLQACYNTVAFACNIAGCFLIERFPRVKYFSTGFIGCEILLLINMILSKQFIGTSNTAGLRANVAILYLFLACYAILMDGALYVYISEIWPNHLRSKGTTIGIVGFCAGNLLLLEVAGTAFAAIGWRFYLVMIIPGLVGIVPVLLYFPETRGKPLEEIAEVFGDADEVAIHQREIESRGIDAIKATDAAHGDYDKGDTEPHKEYVSTVDRI